MVSNVSHNRELNQVSQSKTTRVDRAKQKCSFQLGINMHRDVSLLEVARKWQIAVNDGAFFAVGTGTGDTTRSSWFESIEVRHVVDLHDSRALLIGIEKDVEPGLVVKEVIAAGRSRRSEK